MTNWENVRSSRLYSRSAVYLRFGGLLDRVGGIIPRHAVWTTLVPLLQKYIMPKNGLIIASPSGHQPPAYVLLQPEPLWGSGCHCPKLYIPAGLRGSRCKFLSQKAAAVAAERPSGDLRPGIVLRESNATFEALGEVGGIAPLTRLAASHNGVFPAEDVSRYLKGSDGVPAHGTRDMPVWGNVFKTMQSPNDTAMINIRVNVLNTSSLSRPGRDEGDICYRRTNSKDGQGGAATHSRHGLLVVVNTADS